MKPIGAIILAVVLGILAKPTRAQNAPPPGGGGDFRITATPGSGPGAVSMRVGGGWTGDLATLVREPAVQEDLKLKDKQKTKLNEALGQLEQKRQDVTMKSFRAMRENAAPGVPGDLPNRDELLAAQADFDHNSEQAIAQVLEPKQMTRLRQIALQQEGLMAVTRDEIAEKINLSDPQRETIQGIVQEMRDAQGELMRSLTGGTGMMVASAKADPGGGPPRPDPATVDRFKKMHEGRQQIRKTELQRINKLLTKKQGASLMKLMGEPFDLKKLSTAAQGLPPFMAKPNENAAAPTAAPSSADEDTSKTKGARTPRRKSSRTADAEKKCGVILGTPYFYSANLTLFLRRRRAKLSLPIRLRRARHGCRPDSPFGTKADQLPRLLPRLLRSKGHPRAYGRLRPRAAFRLARKERRTDCPGGRRRAAHLAGIPCPAPLV